MSRHLCIGHTAAPGSEIGPGHHSRGRVSDPMGEAVDDADRRSQVLGGIAVAAAVAVVIAVVIAVAVIVLL